MCCRAEGGAAAGPVSGAGAPVPTSAGATGAFKRKYRDREAVREVEEEGAGIGLQAKRCALGRGRAGSRCLSRVLCTCAPVGAVWGVLRSVWG